MRFTLFNRLFVLEQYKLLPQTVGLRSNTIDKQHILCIDCDDMPYEKLIQKVDSLQLKYKLSDAYIFQSSKDKYHVIVLDKFKFGEVLDILQDFDNQGTKKYQLFSVRRDAFILRFSPKGKKEKPKFLEVCKGYLNKRYQSSAHAMFLQAYYHIQPKLNNPDGHTKMYYVIYPTVDKENHVKPSEIFVETD